MTASLRHSLNRTVVIRATPETVFSFFQDSERWARWWGAGSTIAPTPGGSVTIRYPNAVEAGGEVLEIDPPRRLVFTFGYVSGAPIGVGASRVTITLVAVPAGTRLDLVHDFEEPAVRDAHVQGWRYQLAVFANAVADLLAADVAATVEAWFDAWATADATARAVALARIVTPAVSFRDRYSLVDGLDDLLAHIDATRQFMPGLRIVRAGDIRQCQGTALADWTVLSETGESRGAGTNIFSIDAAGRIGAVTGIWRVP